MKTYAPGTQTILLSNCSTNGSNETKPVTFTLLLEEAAVNSKNRPDRLIIEIEGRKRTELGFLEALPGGAMTVEDALLLWGKWSPHRDRVIKVLNSIAAMRASCHAAFHAEL